MSNVEQVTSSIDMVHMRMYIRAVASGNPDRIHDHLLQVSIPGFHRHGETWVVGTQGGATLPLCLEEMDGTWPL